MNLKYIVSFVVVASFFFLSTAAPLSEDTAARDTPVTKTPYSILFFMNPNGRPCQMQDLILEGIVDSLKDKATIIRYKTTEPADRAMFGTYGIRGLPSLVILDINGKTVKRFTPGIQEGKTILAVLTKKK